ncbi:MAG: hypothetical protein HZB19_09020 [Chloroflexi bacterium]|nr:hypothetical protein [Chloroflexota bacterium]
MPKNRSIQKSKGLPALPGEYDQLLRDYVEILEKTFPNPYELSLRKRLWDWFDIGGQIKYASSPYISSFVKTPNTLAQELPGALEILKRLDKFDDDSLRTLAEMNSMNLSRLKRRSVTEAIPPAIALIGSVIGLLPAFQSIFPISLSDSLVSWILQITISLLLKILVVAALLLGIGNRMVTIPRIGIVDALGGILHIAITYRNGK